jgi:hypothetical protein
VRVHVGHPAGVREVEHRPIGRLRLCVMPSHELA